MINILNHTWKLVFLYDWNDYAERKSDPKAILVIIFLPFHFLSSHKMFN
jgi:hypothetical protein